MSYVERVPSLAVATVRVGRLKKTDGLAIRHVGEAARLPGIIWLEEKPVLGLLGL